MVLRVLVGDGDTVMLVLSYYHGYAICNKVLVRVGMNTKVCVKLEESSRKKALPPLATQLNEHYRSRI